MSDTALSVEEVRAEVRAWLDDNWNPDATVAEWWKRLAAAGYSAPMLPADVGGRDWSRDLALAVNAELAAHGAVGPPMGLGLMLAAPTIAVHGTPAQQARYLPPILDGSEAWCQLFSEPGAGSDLAGLQARAVRDGDEWIVSGQKVWTSGAQHAQWGMLLARTNPDLPKHKGISYFAFDMRQPGVEVRPLREMTGRAMFNEVFLDEARVPHDALIGGLNNGWQVANTTLTVERSSIGSGGNAGLGVALPGPTAGHLHRRAGDFVSGRTATGAGSISTATVRRFAALAAANGSHRSAVVRQGLAELYVLTELNRLNTLRARDPKARTGGEGNLAKMLLTHTLRRAREIGNLILGADGMLWGDEAATGGAIQELTVFSPGPSIYGGTDQVQRNIVGERVLGLPKEPGDQRDTPFKDLLTNPHALSGRPHVAAANHVDALPRAGLLDAPTPLQHLERFGAAIGADVWIKRDDVGPVGLAGNKVRKFDVVLGAALSDGVDTLVTAGALQSNSARTAAAAAAARGLRCVLVLGGDRPPHLRGNALLDLVFGAELRFQGDVGWDELGRAVEATAAELGAGGERVVTAPVGCSSPLGALGFTAAWFELADQLAAQGVRPIAVYHASTSGGTHAGLVLGRALGGAGPEVRGVLAGHLHADTEAAALTLARAAARHLLGRGPGDDVDLGRFHLDGGHVGAGYGVPTDEGRHALALLARTEGIVVDPVYSAKALAALVADAGAGRLDGPVVFWHTGGWHALFDPTYGDEMS